MDLGEVSVGIMSGKAERRAAREVVAAYHETQLRSLLAHVGESIDRFQAGDLDAFETDRVMFQYSRAAKELWKFCSLTSPEVAACVIADEPVVDWWDRGEPRRE